MRLATGAVLRQWGSRLAWVVAVFGAGPLCAEDRALIVGVGDYINPEISDLQGTRNDAMRFREFISDELNFDPGDIVTLIDREATMNAVTRAIETHLIHGSQAGDRVLFYYSGHGMRIPDRNGDESDEFDEAIALADFSSGRGYLLDDEVERYLAELRDRQVMFVFDSCHSGTIDRAMGQPTADAPQARFTEIDELPTLPRDTASRAVLELSNAEEPLDGHTGSTVIWTAAAPAQAAWEEKGAGIFTSRFIEGVRTRRADLNRNGRISNSELLTYVRRFTESWCASNKNCTAGFTPTVTGPQDVLDRDFLTSLAPQTEAPPPSDDPASEDVQEGPDGLDVSDIFASENSAGLHLWIGSGSELAVGDLVQIRAMTDVPGLLLLFDIDPKGDLYQLFPSPLSKPGVNRIGAGEVVVIPEAQSRNGMPIQIRVTEPAGYGRLLALLVEDRADELSDLTVLSPDLAPGPVPDAGGFLRALADSLQGVISNADGNRAVRWSAAVLDYSIRP